MELPQNASAWFKARKSRTFAVVGKTGTRYTFFYDSPREVKHQIDIDLIRASKMSYLEEVSVKGESVERPAIKPRSKVTIQSPQDTLQKAAANATLHPGAALSEEEQEAAKAENTAAKEAAIEAGGKTEPDNEAARAQAAATKPKVTPRKNRPTAKR